MKEKGSLVFVSHASSDKDVVDKLIDLIQTGCNVASGQTICTSINGLGIPIGTESWVSYLKTELRKANLVVVVLSEGFMASQVCLCELGAAWVLDVPVFLIVLPPLKKSELKAILGSAQAGMITDSDCLDELCEKMEKCLGVKAPLSRWNAKRDQFLKAIPPVLDSLPHAQTVKFEKFRELEKSYKQCLDDIAESHATIAELKDQIAELSILKDATGVKKVKRKFSTVPDEFESLCDEARTLLTKLQAATRKCLFWGTQSANFFPKGDDEWQEITGAEMRKEIKTFHPDEGYRPNLDHPKVQAAVSAIESLGDFVEREDLAKELDEEYDFPMTLESADFWKEFLVSVV